MENLCQEIFELQQIAGNAVVNEEFRWILDSMGLDPWLVQQEERIRIVQFELDNLNKDFTRLDFQIKEDQNNGMPDHVLAEDIEKLLWLERKIAHRQKWLANLEEGLDEWAFNKAEPEETEILEETIPHHWIQAKAYWDWILEWVDARSHKTPREGLCRIWARVEKAKKAKSIGSWHYFAILNTLALRLNKPFEVLRLATYAERCERAAKAKGRTWGPDHSKDEIYAEIARVPGIQLYQEELASEYSLWDENDLIDAIDKRHSR